MINKLCLFLGVLLLGHSMIAQCYFHEAYKYEPSSGTSGGASLISKREKITTTGNVNFSSSSGDFGTYTIRVNECGDTIWQKAYNYAPLGDEAGKVIIEVNDTVLCIIGQALDTAQQRREGFIMFIDTSGSVLTRKTLDAGAKNEIMRDAVLFDDGIIAGGYFNELMPDSNQFLIKTDLQGNVQWVIYYGITGSTFSKMRNFDKAKDGGYVIGGDMDNTTAVRNISLIKTDSFGNQQWQKTYRGINNENTGGGYVLATKDGGYFMCGAVANPTAAFVVKTDSAGNVKWQKRFNNPFPPYALLSAFETWGGDYIVAGAIEPNATTKSKIYLAKLSQDSGTVIWERVHTYYGGNSHDYIEKMILTQEGDIAGTGFIIPPQGSNEVFILKTDSCGYLDSDSIKADFTVSIDTATKTITLINQSQHYCSTNWYYGDGGSSTAVNPTYTYTTDGVYNITLLIRAGNTTDVVTRQITIGNPSAITDGVGHGQGLLGVYPNPANSSITITTQGTSADAYLLYDITGRVVLSGAIESNSQAVDVSALSKGVYLFKATEKSKTVGNGKMVKE